MQGRLACLDCSLLLWYFLFQSLGFLLCLALYLWGLLTGHVSMWGLVDSSDVEMLRLQ